LFFCFHHLIGLYYANSAFVGNHPHFRSRNKVRTTRVLNKTWTTPSLPFFLLPSALSLKNKDATVPDDANNSNNPGWHTGTPTTSPTSR
jgi:hypothetical protein